MNKISPETRARMKTRTLLAHVGRNPEEQFGFVNMPAYRGSTVIYPDAATLRSGNMRFVYGTKGTPSTEALESAWSELAGAAGTVLAPTGLAAITIALLAAVKAGDHLLVTDSAYRPTRNFCEHFLAPMGVETSYFDPYAGGDIDALFRPNTSAVVVEAPGSQSFEMQDIPAIAAAARARGVCTIMDNTWATPIFFPPHERGVDLAIEAGTKYLSGHSDILLGLVSATAEWMPKLRRVYDLFAMTPGPEDVFLALRGLRTMELRLREAERQALAMAHWLAKRPEVKEVLHPALPTHRGHDIWKRDFSGSSGLFSIVLHPAPDHAVDALLDALELFAMGYSWGGYESLIIPFDCAPYRTATSWRPGGPALRLQIGLEHTDDLKADLEQGFAALHKAMQKG